MRESRLENELAQAEEVYDDLIQVRRSLGTMLAETIRKGRGRHSRSSNTTGEISPS